MIGIYRKSFGFFLSSLPALLAFAATIEVLLWVLQPKSESTVSFAALTIVAYYFHRHFLFGETLSLRNKKPAAGVPPLKFGWFMLVSAGLILVPVALSLTLVVGVLDQSSTGAFVVVFLLTYLVTLSLFGTALPATVMRDDTYRLSQGIRATASTMWRLLLGPGLVGLVILLATGLAGYALGALGVTQDSLLTLAYYTLIRTLGFLTTIFAVAVLCEMYRKTRPEPRISQGPGVPDQTPA